MKNIYEMASVLFLMHRVSHLETEYSLLRKMYLKSNIYYVHVAGLGQVGLCKLEDCV